MSAKERGERAEGTGPDRLARLMRLRGLRLTGPRRVVAEVLEAADEHLDAESVVKRAQRIDPTIHRATVYRTLQHFKRLGLVDELDLMHVSGERHYYEVRPACLHIHLVCTSCRKVEEPSGPYWDGLKRRVERDTGFYPETVRIEMAGLCARCRARKGVAGRASEAEV